MSTISLALDTDSDIIREYNESRSERAAIAFVRKYQKFVYATAYRYLQNSFDAEDAAQEAFIKALSHIDRFRGDSSLKTWLYRITANVSVNMLRKKKVLSVFKKEDIGREEFYDLPSSDLPPDKQFENKEFEKNFFEILSKLPEKQRETFALRYFEDMSYEEISKMLGTSVGGLKANYFQAVQKLAKYLQKDRA